MTCSPCQVVAEVESLVRVRADAKGLKLKIEFRPPIPEFIQTDPTRLRQILINIVGNAIKFTEVGDVRLTASLQSDAAEQPVLQFDVVDTGVGIAPEQITNLFHAFAQADASTTRRFGGSGLGLTISQRLARLLGGDVSIVQSEPGKGAHIRATVQTGSLEGMRMLDDPWSAVALREGDRAHSCEAAEPSRLNCRILLAEDGPDNQRLIAHLLRKAGAEVTIVDNGELAVGTAMKAQAQHRPFDVILMDMQMPVLCGYGATQQLRARGYAGPIIALTAHAMAGDRDRCLAAGCDDYVSKPIDRVHLFRTLGRTLGLAVQPQSSSGGLQESCSE
jgi:CheY-like chemotaxis protein